jgi:hypothetical protein
MSSQHRTARTMERQHARALQTYTWATIEAKNLLLCISIAADHGECVDDDLRPALGVAIDGVARLLDGVSRQFEHLDVRETKQEATEVSRG